MRLRARGFSLVELLVVVAILLTIAAIAIPSYLSAMQRAREAGAVAYLRQLQTAQENYRIAHHEYADTFAKLAPYVTTQAAIPASPSGTSSNLLFAFVLPSLPQGKGQGQGQGGTPPGQGGSPPGHSGTAPGQGGTPPGRGGTPPGQGGTPSGAGTPSGGTTGGGTSGGTPYTDSIVHSLFIYRLSRPSALQWQCVAEPLRDRDIGRFFYTDNSNVIRFALGAIPNASSPQI